MAVVMSGITFLGLALAVVATSPSSYARPPPPPPPCGSPACEKLEQAYSSLKNETCGQVVKAAPTFDAADETAFMNVYKNFTGGSAAEEAPVMAAAKKLLTASDVATFLALPDSFSSPEGLDANMVKCALLSQATPTALAMFAATGATEEALVSQLLNDTMLMRDMLVAGGAFSSEDNKGRGGPLQYGPAMAIWVKLQQASPKLAASVAAAAAAAPTDSFWDDRSQTTILKRLALATALAHAVPIHHKYSDPACDEAYDWCPKGLNNTDLYVDPIERYLHYEKWYHAGELDPAIEVLSTWECAHTVNSDASHEDLEWLRKTLANYRPDHIATGYSWRYARSVKTDVAYGDPQCATFLGGICDGHYSQIPAANGVCGPRAFFGRFTRLAFGLPVWGATQPGHAAMTTWTPDGWTVLLGAGWPFCWWGDRSGPDWLLEAQARENRADFQKVLRGGWVSEALGEPPVAQDWGHANSKSGYGTGGTWAALMLYAKKISVNETKPPPRDMPTPLVPTKVAALISKWGTKPATPNITTGSDGTIHIPAAAFSYKNRSASVSVMQSMDAGEQIIHGGCSSDVGAPCLDPASSSFAYDVTAPSASTYYLTANVSTWHVNQDLFVSVNGAKAQEVPVFYTVGFWNQTQPLAVPLVDGKNTLSFTRSSVRELVIKEFALYTHEPIVPKPPTNYTPVPPPPAPPASQYIEVPADTTCEKQGIDPVPSDLCVRACVALDFKSTGPRDRPNISGCFVMTEGQYAGNCGYNTNKSATCTPPCTLFGAVVRSLCIRS